MSKRNKVKEEVSRHSGEQKYGRGRDKDSRTVADKERNIRRFKMIRD